MRALLAAVLMLLLPASAGAATITISPGQSVGQAASGAQAGDTIVMSPGQYGSQSISGTRQLTVKAQGAVMPGLSVNASNLTWVGGNVDSGGQVRQAMYFSNAHNVTLKDLRVGNNRESILVMMDGGYPSTGSVTDVTFDNVELHDSYIAHGSAKHVECVFMGGTQRIKFLNSWFHDCTTFDVFVTEAGGDLPDGLVVENTVMEGPWADGDPNIGETPRSIGQPGLAWRSSTGLVRNATLRNSTFLSEVRWPSTTPQGTNRAVGNIFAGGTSCKAGVTFANNVKTGSPCSATDKSASSFGFVRSGADGGDYHLTASSPAVDAASPSDHPAADRDGVTRSATTPDAGAYELASDPLPVDSDGDGVPDSSDACPNQAGSQADGCPPPPPPPPADTDGDGVPDSQDACPNVAGSQADGCNPAPPPDPCTQTEAERDQALADLADTQAALDASEQNLSDMTDSRDAWKARAEKAEDQVARIKSIASE